VALLEKLSSVIEKIEELAKSSKIYLCESGFSAPVHIKTEARNQRVVKHDKRLALSSTQPRIFDVSHTVAKSTVALKMFVKFNCRLKLDVIKCIFMVKMLW